MNAPTRPASAADLVPSAPTLSFPRAARLPLITSTPRVEGTSVVVSAVCLVDSVRLIGEASFRAEFERHPNLGYWGTAGVSFTPESVRVNGREVDASALVDAFAAYEEASSLADDEFADELVRNAEEG